MAKITPQWHLEEGNRQTEQESEKQCQFIYTAELCEEKDFENVSIHVPHLSVQNKTANFGWQFFFYYLMSCFAVPVF
jgi:hypothetical protein